MTKTFKIGEYAKGGIIKVTSDRNARLRVDIIDMFSKEVIERRHFDFVDKAKMIWFLEDNTTPYYAEKIIKHFYA
jgi:hypothetical protein